MVSTRKMKSQNKRHFNWLNGTLNDFVIDDGITVNALGNETQANGRHENSENVVDSASQNQATGSNTDDRIRDAADSAVSAVQNCMHDAVLKKVNNVVIPRVVMAVRSTTDSSRNGPNCKVQYPDRTFTWNTENTPLR